ncbi:hypothetical protein [Ehrlichia ruminantium]|uniref:hypothetical protein n=1 Tax=Ehrlichia ruminantium TaxID=779 RepID=UPI0015DF2B7F|nr:hypothetical protein [Ehrlichia ruminantium]UOD97787.1 hypothetical protein IMW64_04370 [Ehrlichia ruminantium]
MMIIRLFARQTNMLNRNLNCGKRTFFVSGLQVVIEDLIKSGETFEDLSCWFN